MAEFKEVVKQRKRMCDYYDFECEKCEIHKRAVKDGSLSSCMEFIDTYTQEAEEIIMKWAEENPAQSNADKFKEVFGVDVNRNKCLFGQSEECKKHLTCYSCHLTNWWNQEYKEPDKEKKNGRI